jgi:hypothetical protein
LVLSYGAPSSPTLQGLMLTDLKEFAAQPYSPFAPATRQGDATQRDFNVTSVWEIANGFEYGTGHVLEGQTEETAYNFAQGQDLSGTPTIGPCLFTAQKGKLLPPPAETVTSTIANFKQFILFNGKLYALTSDAAGKIYEHNGTTWTLRETLTSAGKQLYTNGVTLWATQGSSNPVRKTTNGTAWSDETFNADFIAEREEANLAYIAASGTKMAKLEPGTNGDGPTYRTPNIGWKGTSATSMLWSGNILYIGKPEGLYAWKQGNVTRLLDTSDQFNTANFSKLVVHKNLLYFNIQNRLYFATLGSGARLTEILPEDQQGFTSIDSLAATFGPLLIGARLQGRSYLFAFDGIDAPGLNPLWSDADGTRPIVACGAADIFGSQQARVYFSQTTTGTVYLDLTQRFTPNTYHTKGTTQSYIDLIEFSAGFRSVPKWFYEIVLNVRNPLPTTFAQIWYSIDGGPWTQTTDETGSAVTLTLDAANKGVYLPLNTTGIKIQVRLYMWTTLNSNAAEITAVTIRGAVMTKRRSQFSFPVKCDQTVRGLTGDIEDSGRNILNALRTAAAQGYPCKLQDPDGNWHLVLFREPYPLEVTHTRIDPNNNQAMEQFKVVQCLLVEVDALDSNGNLNAWSAG